MKILNDAVTSKLGEGLPSRSGSPLRRHERCNPARLFDRRTPRYNHGMERYRTVEDVVLYIRVSRKKDGR